MKNKIFYRLGFLACILALTLTSCQGDYDEPVKTADEAGIGNSSISETNVVTIAQLKETYKSAITTSYSYKKVEEPMEIKGYVTGNDVQGNLYNEIVIADSTGAISVCVAQGGLYGIFPVGAEVIIELKDKIVKGEGADSTEIFAAGHNEIVEEACRALIMLGFSKQNVNKAVQAILKANPKAKVEDVIKSALKML